VEEPNDVCASCVVGEDTADCDDAGNPTTNRGGTASCIPAGYDWSECTECDGETTPPTCAEYTDGELHGGDVQCSSGSWDDSGCTPCQANASVDCIDIAGG